MKRLLSVVLALIVALVLTVGCAGVRQAAVNDPGSVSSILELSKGCEVDQEGYLVVTIPMKKAALEAAKKEDKAEIAFSVFKHKDGSYGFAIVNEYGNFVMTQWVSTEKTWLCASPMFGEQTLTEEQAKKLWNDWLMLYKEFGDPSRAYCGLATFECDKTKI